MALILNIETSTKVCSVALGKDRNLIALKESRDENYAHSENLTTYIQETLSQARFNFRDLDAIAVSKGPGSYTGLRIGVSTAKGLCYALDKPLIGIETLKAMAHGLVASPPGPLFTGEGMLGSPVYHTTKMEIWKSLKEFGREMRKEPTKAEGVLWKKLRNNQIGYKIRRQHTIDKFIIDFVCLDRQLAIEVDGEIHKNQMDKDRLRDEIIGDRGFTVLRFSNEEVLSDIDRVVAEIKKVLDEKSIFSLKGHYSLPQRGRVGDGALLCPMLDARRMEVYCAVYDLSLNEIKKTSAEIIDENSFSELLKKNVIYFFGEGAEKCKTILSQNPNAKFIDNIFPSAKNMIPFSEEAFVEKKLEDLAYFEPFYLKDFVGRKISGGNLI